MANIIRGGNTKYINPHFGEYMVSGSENEFRKGSIKEIVHDGDTIKVSSRGNFSIRFLGIDTPEISFEINGDGVFHYTHTQKWIDYLDNLLGNWRNIKDVLGEELFNYIQAKLEKGHLAINHSIHAKRVEDQLEQFVEEDMALLSLSKDTMKFFLPFSYEILDGYGRLLGFVHPDLKNPLINISTPPNRLPSYNQRILESGHSLPYFIWPNVNPFRKESSIVKAVYNSPTEFREHLNRDVSFDIARNAVKDARRDGIGVFESDFAYEDHTGVKPLILEAFELRYLSRQEAPNRYFIDINAEDNRILHPLSYFNYLPEDRLFIPTQYVPLFEKTGWVVE